ncbi:hypothetical protein GCM10028827_23150 [Mucilaginibacter myungsuensis]
MIAAVLICCLSKVRAQSASFQEVDSLSYAKYQAADWKDLVAYGNSAISAKVDYPLLRLRIAYAQFVLGNYGGALSNYQKVLGDDSHNQMARYYSYLSNKYLDREGEASYHASFLDTVTLNRDNIKPLGALQAGFEFSFKTNDNTRRGYGLYNRVSFSNRLGWRFQLDQSVAYFNQSISSGVPVIIPGSTLSVNFTYNNSQLEYYAKLRYMLSGRLSLIGAYHFLNTSFGPSTYSSHVGLFGVRYAHPYFSLQADANSAQLINTAFQQYNGQLTLHPLGNLNLYTISRASMQANGMQQKMFSQSVGFKAANKLWLEVNGTFGRLDGYLDADALYVYNAIDVTSTKAGATVFYTLNKHLNLLINYTYEQKQDYYLNNNYTQNSITGGITWRF